MTILLFSFLIFAGFADQNPPIILKRGESKYLSIHQNLTLFVQTKGIVSLSDEGNKLRITGKKIGETQISNGKKKYHIIVLSKKNYRTWKELKTWIKNRRGLRLKATDKTITLEGHFLTSSDFIDLAPLKGIHFINKAKFSLRSQPSSKAFIKKVFQSANLEASQITFIPNLLVTLSKNQKIKEFKRALSPFGASIEVQDSSLSIKPIIKVKVLIAQVKKSFFRHWGVEWPGSVEAQVLNRSAAISSLNLTAHTLEKQGWGKVLASPTLVTQSGKKAHFHSGGEFPIKNSNQFSQQVAWKKYGITLKILPYADQNNHLRIDIKNEISMLDHSQTVDGVPAIARDEFHSVFNLKRPRPILISGLFKKEWGESRQGLPLLSQIPIFRHLFSDEAEADSETELVFIVTPEILEP